MNLEFHYYIIYILARYAGLPEAACIKVAYSSQYVDNNVVGHIIKVNGKTYHTFITHNYGFWSDWFPRYVYVPFHFFPGDPSYPYALRKDRRQHPLNCTPGGRLVTELLSRALASADPYRIGIALHTYADSFAHQNFTGTNDDWNALGANIPVPRVGHAEILATPDILGARWIDPRLEGSAQFIDNQTRFLEAASYIYRYLCQFSGKKADGWERLRDRLKELIGERDETDAQRDERITNYILEEELLEYNKYDWLREAVFIEERQMNLEDSFQGYDKLSWLQEQLLYKTGILEKTPLLARPHFFDTDYFRWQEAAKTQLKEAQLLLTGLL